MAGAAGVREREAQVAEEAPRPPLGDVPLRLRIRLGAGDPEQQPFGSQMVIHAPASCQRGPGTVRETMGHGHSHAHGHAHGAAASRRILLAALALTVAFGVVQVIGALAFDSLALIADAVHNISDGAAIGLATLAAWAASRPAAGRRTFGWRRVEILAALVNGLALLGLGIWIVWDAIGRIADPPDVDAGGVLVIGLLGAARTAWSSGCCCAATAPTSTSKGALRHAAADVAGSLGAALGAVTILATGWNQADAVVALLIGLLVLASSWTLVRRPVEILLEVAPAHLESEEIGRALAAGEGVASVHDLHVWTVTSNMVSLSAHVVARPGADQDAILHNAQELLRERFGIWHATIQIDRDHSHELLTVHRLGCPEGPRARTGP